VATLRPALNDRQIARMAFRIALFMKRGHTEPEAEALADRLADRDYDGDDRRMCVECAHVRPQYRCEAGGAAIRGLLQRCPLFAWEMPA
jgi:hypothetical protein